MSPRTVDELLDEARSRIRRLDPHAACEAWRSGALLVDIRPTLQREIEGSIPGALVVERNVFEWRFDPAGDHRLAEVRDHGQDVVVVCSEGYASSLVAAVLVDLGFETAADLEGGFVAWAEAGLPVEGGLAVTGGRSGADVVA
jgi:rhodanese-related sulfurtransferase